MLFASPAEYLAHARANGILTPERVAELTADESLPSRIDEFMIALRERGIIASDSVEDLIAVNATASESFPAVEMLTPADETGEAFTPAAIEELDEPFVPTLNTTLKPTPRRTEPAMTREKMWTWFAIGGALWLIGFIILGVWLGGCLDSKPASRPSKTQKN